MAAKCVDSATGSVPIDVAPALEELLRLLLAHATPRECDEQEREEEIILDVDLEDGRYLLVRVPRVDSPRTLLSPREQEIARMVAQGHPNKVIAEVLSISSWTVCTYLRRIFAKLGVASRAAIVARLHESWGVRDVKPLAPRVAVGRTGFRKAAAAS